MPRTVDDGRIFRILDLHAKNVDFIPIFIQSLLELGGRHIVQSPGLGIDREIDVEPIQANLFMAPVEKISLARIDLTDGKADLYLAECQPNHVLDVVDGKTRTLGPDLGTRDLANSCRSCHGTGDSTCPGSDVHLFLDEHIGQVSAVSYFFPVNDTSVIIEPKLPHLTVAEIF